MRSSRRSPRHGRGTAVAAASKAMPWPTRWRGRQPRARADRGGRTASIRSRSARAAPRARSRVPPAQRRPRSSWPGADLVEHRRRVETRASDLPGLGAADLGLGAGPRLRALVHAAAGDRHGPGLVRRGRAAHPGRLRLAHFRVISSQRFVLWRRARPRPHSRAHAFPHRHSRRSQPVGRCRVRCPGRPGGRLAARQPRMERHAVPRGPVLRSLARLDGGPCARSFHLILEKAATGCTGRGSNRWRLPLRDGVFLMRDVPHFLAPMPTPASTARRARCSRCRSQPCSSARRRWPAVSSRSTGGWATRARSPSPTAWVLRADDPAMASGRHPVRPGRG